MHHFDPSKEIQDHLVFGEYGGVNPSVTDSSTYTFLSPEKMKELFDHEIEGCFLYSRGGSRQRAKRSEHEYYWVYRCRQYG